MSDTCKSCGAAIIWITDQKGTRLPINKKRVRVYEFTSKTKGHYKEMATWTSKGVTPSEPLLYHISHFVTCPDATKHSKRNVD